MPKCRVKAAAVASAAVAMFAVVRAVIADSRDWWTVTGTP